MNKLLRFILLVLVFALGWGLAWHLNHRSMDMLLTVMQEIEKKTTEDHAREAYESQPAPVVVWEFKHLEAILLDKLKKSPKSPKSIKLQLFLVHARMARVLDLEKSKSQAMEHYQEATNYYNPGRVDAGRSEAQITNFTNMLNLLVTFDQIGKLHRANNLLPQNESSAQ